MAFGILTAAKHFLSRKKSNFTFGERALLAEKQRNAIIRILSKKPEKIFSKNREKTLGIFENLDAVLNSSNLRFPNEESESEYQQKIQIFRKKFVEAMVSAGYNKERAQINGEFYKFSGFGFAAWVERLFTLDKASLENLLESIFILEEIFYDIFTDKKIVVEELALERVERNLEK